MGRLTADPTVRYTNSQTPVVSITIACERDIASNGERKTDFIECVAWRQAAEFIGKYFHKGSLAVVSGRLELRDWEDKDGNKRRNAEINVEHIYFGETKRNESNDTKATPDDVNPGDFVEMDDIDGQLPF